MDTNKCRCSNDMTVNYFNLQYLCDQSKRWLCQICFNNKKKKQMKPMYANSKAAIKKFNKDVLDQKIKRRDLMLHLKKNFDELPFQQKNKLYYEKEISQINTLFTDILNNPFSETDLQGLQELQIRLQDENFNKLTEQDIKKFLSIGRGHYQWDNSKIKEILTIMSNIDEIQLNHIFLSLKLVAKQQETSKYFERGIENNEVIDQICIAKNNLLYCPSYLNDDPNLYEDSDEYNWIIQQERCWIQSIYTNNKKKKFQIFLNILPEFMTTSKCILKNSILLFQQHLNLSNQNKLYVICAKQKKIIRSYIFSEKYESLQQCDFKTTQLITLSKNNINFYNMITLKLKIKIKLLQKPYQIQFMQSRQKIILSQDKQLMIFDLDYQNNQLINCQYLSNYRIDDFILNQTNNFIILTIQDKIVILDQYFIELKSIDRSLQQGRFISTQTSDDMKFIYQNVKSKSYVKSYIRFQIFKICLLD